MKKIFFGLMAMVAFVATSCQQDADLTVNAGETAIVTFNLATPQIASKADFSDGTTATHLQYAVYDANGDILNDLAKTDDEIHTSKVVEFQLTTGNTYTVLFWAAAPNAPYTVDLAAKTMEVDYNGAVSSDENRDAFYFYSEPFTVSTGMAPIAAELRRPFAQLNIGTNDYAASTSAGYTVTEAKVSTYAYTSLNFKTGEVDGKTAVVFDYAPIPTTQTFPVAGNEYMAMNYLLMANTKETVDVEFTYTDGAVEKTRTVGSVPVQRNYRTNLYGQLLTSDVAANVEIKPEYADAFNNEGYFVTTNANGEVSTATALSAKGLATIADQIADGTISGDVDIVLNGNIDLAELATRAVTTNWAPIGTEAVPFTGTFDGHGFTIKNFAYASEASDFYVGFFGYAKNATIKNVTFENVYVKVGGEVDSNEGGHIAAIVGALEGTSTIENVTVKGDIQVEADVTANNASRVAVVVGGNGYGNVTVKNVHIVANEGSYVKANNCVGAIAGQLNWWASFENCSSNIDVTGTKFFAGGICGIAPTQATFVNCHTTGDIAITAGRSGTANDHYRVGGIAGGWDDNTSYPCVLTNCSYTGKVSGTNADGRVAETLDYLGYVGRGYSLTGREGSKVIIDGISFVQVGNAAPFGNYQVTLANGESAALVENAEELQDALAAGSSVLLYEDINVSKLDLTALTNDVVIDANGKTITTSSNYGVQVTAGKNITLKNATVEITVDGNYITYAAGFKVENGDYQNKTIKLENCEIRMCNTDWAYAVTMPASVKNLNLVIDGCTLEGAVAFQCWGDNNTITVTNSKLICNYTTSAMYTSYCVALQGDGAYNSENNTLNISGCEFSYSGVDNFNSSIKAVYNSSNAINNTITVVDCTYDNKVIAY